MVQHTTGVFNQTLSIYTVLCTIKVYSNTIELTVQTTCYVPVVGNLCCKGCVCGGCRDVCFGGGGGSPHPFYYVWVVKNEHSNYH